MRCASFWVMARIDRILMLVKDQAANELRMGTGAEPKMLAYGAPKRLSMATTDEDSLRDLLGELLTPEREAAMRGGRVDFVHQAEGAGTHQVALTGRTGGFDVVFLRDGDGARARPSPTKLSEPEVHPAPPVGDPAALSLGDAPIASRTATLEPMRAAAPAVVYAVPVGGVVLAPGLLALLARVPSCASDVHLAVGEIPMVRVDGVLRTQDDEPVVTAELLALEPALEAQLLHARSLDRSVELPGNGRARLHVFCTDAGRALSIRILPRTAPTLASLNMPVPLDALVSVPHGLVLVCGATGSGKSTTLAALAREVVTRRSVVLSTLEDPIEYALSASSSSVIRRRQIGRDVADFASGLRDALRQDPDVILIVELRDAETIGLALTAAETGHLVLASLHSGSAASSIERIVDSYPPMRAQQIRVQLADVLRAVVAQRLLPRARGAGRIPVVEVMLGNSAIGSLIREGKTAQIPTTIQASRREGMITLERCLADRVLAGEIRIEDARAAANHRAALESFLASR